MNIWSHFSWIMLIAHYSMRFCSLGSKKMHFKMVAIQVLVAYEKHSSAFQPIPNL